MRRLLLVIPLFTAFISQAQVEDPAETPDILTIGVGAGFASFMGDIGKESEISKLSNIRTNFSFNLERRFGEIIGVQIDGLYGTLAYNERSKDIDLNKNFETPLFQIGANIVLHFDNDLVINRDSPFSPYLSAGVHYLKFDPHGDLFDADNVAYNYWDDGTIRDIPQADLLPKDTISNRILRDYSYETQLKDSVTNYSRGALTIPLTFGLKWKFTPRVQGRIFGTYNLVMSDWVDNIQANGDNDKYVFVGFSLHYVLRKANKQEKERYEDVDFADLKNEDSDNDGVKDTKDKCQHTPEGVEVDKYGCPKDDDNDGVGNYLDKEPNTPEGAVVTLDGVELTDVVLAAQIAERNKIIESRQQSFSEDASQESLDKISEEIVKTRESSEIAASLIPEELQEADVDNDGLITSKEIEMCIDGFFEGSNNFTVGLINDLIDYFFEQ